MLRRLRWGNKSLVAVRTCFIRTWEGIGCSRGHLNNKGYNYRYKLFLPLPYCPPVGHMPSSNSCQAFLSSATNCSSLNILPKLFISVFLFSFYLLWCLLLFLFHRVFQWKDLSYTINRFSQRVSTPAPVFSSPDPMLVISTSFLLVIMSCYFSHSVLYSYWIILWEFGGLSTPWVSLVSPSFMWDKATHKLPPLLKTVWLHFSAFL